MKNRTILIICGIFLFIIFGWNIIEEKYQFNYQEETITEKGICTNLYNYGNGIIYEDLQYIQYDCDIWTGQKIKGKEE